MEARELYEIFRTAIRDEYRMYEFYTKAAQSASDPDAKELFENLAAVELEHENQLQKVFKKTKEKYEL